MSFGADEIDSLTLRAARRGDHRALAAIIRHYDNRLRHLAFHLLRDETLIDDALQDVYVKAFRNLKGFRSNSTLGTWLYRITYTTCVTYLRRRPDVWSTEAVPETADPSVDPARSLSETQALVALLRSLPDDQIAAVLLVDAYDLGYRRAAVILGAPVTTVASRVKAARAKLRAILNEGETIASNDETDRVGDDG